MESGVNHFTFNQHHAATREQAVGVVSIYDFTNGGQVGAGLADTHVLLLSDSIGFLQLASHGKFMVKRCIVWYATFLTDS